MATWQQWRDSADKGQPRRVTWVCGPERVLVEEIVTETRRAVAPTDGCYVSLTAGQDPERAIWAAAQEVPLAGTRRLVVVREAQRLRNWGELEPVIAAWRELSSAWLLLVSAEDDFASVDAGDGKKDRAAHIALIRDKGQAVRCGPLSADSAVKWAVSRCPGLNSDLARHLMDRCGGDLGRASSVLAQLRLLGKGNERVVDVLCAGSGAGGLADELCLLRRPAALAAADGIDRAALGQAIGLLEARLEILGALHAAVSDGASPRDMAARGIPSFAIQLYRGVAGEYDRASVARRRSALAIADNAWRSGADIGVAEVLISLW
jgi:DNA polymerase III delta subunit